MKPGCFVLSTLVISLLGHQTNAGPSNRNQQHILGPKRDPFRVRGTGGSCATQGCRGSLSGRYGGNNGPSEETGSFPGSGGRNFGVARGTDSEGNYGANTGGDYGGSSGGSSVLSGALGGSLVEAIPGGELEPTVGNGIGPNVGGGEGSSDAGAGGGGGIPSRGSLGSLSFPSVGEGLGGHSLGLRAGVIAPGGAGDGSDLVGYGTPGGRLDGSPPLATGFLGSSQPGRRPGGADSLSSSSSVVGEIGGYGVMGGPRSPESEGAGMESSRDRVALERFPGSPSRNSAGSYSAGSPGGIRLPTGREGLSGGFGAPLGGLESGAEGGMRSMGPELSGLEGVRNSLGIGGGAEGGFLGRLRARIRASARALAAARARARARAKARARARALAYKRLRARLHAALHSGLSIGGGIEAGLDKAAEFTGAGVLGGRTGLDGEGGTGAGLAANGDPSASATAGSVFYGGTVGYGGSYGGGYGGAYEFYSE